MVSVRFLLRFRAVRMRDGRADDSVERLDLRPRTVVADEIEREAVVDESSRGWIS